MGLDDCGNEFTNGICVRNVEAFCAGAPAAFYDRRSHYLSAFQIQIRYYDECSFGGQFFAEHFCDARGAARHDRDSILKLVHALCSLLHPLATRQLRRAKVRLA